MHLVALQTVMLHSVLALATTSTPRTIAAPHTAVNKLTPHISKKLRLNILSLLKVRKANMTERKPPLHDSTSISQRHSIQLDSNDSIDPQQRALH